LIEIPRPRPSQSKPSDLARTRLPRGELVAKVPPSERPLRKVVD